MSNVRKAVFLDRDGVLNEPIVRDGLPYSPRTPEEFILVPGAVAALERLKTAGFLLFVVTNQPEVARGKVTRAEVEAMNSVAAAALPVDDFFICWHDDQDACPCRKPKPGLLHEAARRHGIDLNHSYLIGDRWRDVDAGAAAGCRTVLIDYGYRDRQPAREPDFRTRSLTAAVEWILSAEMRVAKT